MEYLLHILILFAIYAVLTCSLDLLVGHLALLSVAHAAFYGLGAYSSALVATYCGGSFFVGLFVGIVVAVLTSFLISLPSLRAHDDYFVIVTFGFQMILFSVLNNWIEVTRGPLGIPGIPQPVVLGWYVDSNRDFLILAVGIATCAFLIVRFLTSAPFGRVLHAIRENELLAKAYGKNSLYFKVTAFAISAALAATAGSLYAHYVTYVDPTSFTVMESILIISMVIIGGAGSVWGPIIGAFALVMLPEALRFVGLPTTQAANLRQIIYGTLLVVMMMFRPRGLMGKYSFAK